MFKHLSIKSRLIFVIAFLAVELIAGAVIGIYNLGIANTELKQMYDHRLVGLGQVGQVTQLITTNQLSIAKAVNLEDGGQRNAALESVDANIAVISKILDSYRQMPMTAGEQALYEQFTEARKVFVEQGIRPAMVAIRGGDNVGAVAQLNGPVTRLYLPVADLGAKLVKEQQDAALREYQASQSTFEIVRAVGRDWPG